MTKAATPARKSAAPLPVPLDGAPAGLPARPDAQVQLDRDLKHLRAMLDTTDVPALRRLEKTVPQLRRQFAAVDRPTTVDEVAFAAADLVRTMSLAGNIDPEPLGGIIAAELAAENVTLYELQCAIRALLRESEFFSLPKLLAEIEQARRRARRHRDTLATDVGETITAIEHQKRQRERERARMIVAIREAIEELRRDGKLCFPIYRLLGIGYLDPALLMEALNDDERERQWATSLFADPERERMRDALPDGWQPPDDERIVEILEEEAEGDDAGYVGDDDEAAA